MANSAKHKNPPLLISQFTVAHSEFGSTITTFEEAVRVPCDLWLTELTVTVTPSTPFDNLVLTALEIYPEQGLDAEFQGASRKVEEILNIWRTADTVGSIITQHPHWLHLWVSSNTEPVIWKQDVFRFFKAGQNLNVRFSAVDKATAPTAGSFTVRIEGKTQVANFNGSPKIPGTFSANTSFLTILAETGSQTYNEFPWIPMVDMRMYNMRMTLLRAIGDDVFYLNDVAMPDWTSWQTGTDAATFDVQPWLYVANNPQVSTDIVQITNFEKGPIFLKKQTPIIFASEEVSAGTSLLFTAELIPNYNNRITLNGAAYDADITADNEELPIMEVPFDMYLESVEVDFTYEGTADINAFLEIHVLKPGDVMGSQSLDVRGGSILTFADNSNQYQGGEVSSSIIDSIPMVLDFSVTTHGSGSSLEMVMDFVPAGSRILATITDVSNTSLNVSVFKIRAQIEGRCMVKHNNPSRFSYLAGEQIHDMADPEVIN